MVEKPLSIWFAEMWTTFCNINHIQKNISASVTAMLLLWRYLLDPLNHFHISWWRHQMETFSALLILCAGNSPVPGEIPAQRPVTRSLDAFFDLRLNKRLSKQSWGWWFENLLWRHCNVSCVFAVYKYQCVTRQGNCVSMILNKSGEN